MRDRAEVVNYLRSICESNPDFYFKTTLLMEFNQALNNAEYNYEDLIAIILREPTIASAILRIANSPLYGLTKRVTSIKQAISFIGFNKIEQIFKAEIIRELLMKDNTSEDILDLWRHSLATAIASQVISQYSKRKLIAEDFYIAGLLHDLGKYIIIKYLPEEYQQIQQTMATYSNSKLLAVERQVMVITHQEIGGFFAKYWCFPDSIVNCIRYHHFFENAPKDKAMVAAITIANTIVKGLKLGNSMNTTADSVSSWIWKFYRINEKDFPQMIDLIYKQYKSTLMLID